MVLCQLVKTAAGCRSVGSSALKVNSQRILRVLIFCVDFLPLLQKLKFFISVNVKVSGLEGPACWSSMTRKEVDCPLDCCCCPLLVTVLC